MNRVRRTSIRWPRVYTPWSACLAVAVAALAVAVSAQPGPEVGADPIMVKGPAAAPVVIVEFSDYQ